MNDRTPANPFAFPRVDNDTLPENDVMGEYQRGMTLRDYFAAKALPAIIVGNYILECEA